MKGYEYPAYTFSSFFIEMDLTTMIGTAPTPSAVQAAPVQPAPATPQLQQPQSMQPAPQPVYQPAPM